MNQPTTSPPSSQTAQVDKDSEGEPNGVSDLEKQNVLSKKTGADQRGQDRPGGAPGSLYQPKTIKFWVIMACNLLCLFLAALDRTIITTAIPRITDQFHSLGDIGWYAAAYMLPGSISQLVYGRIYKFYDMKWVFLTTVILFEIGSAVCGAAPNSGAFIAGRAIAGLASAGLFSGCMLIMMALIPLHKQPMFQATFGGAFAVASVMGPLIGGGFTSSVTWRWCFYINIPIGAVAWILMFLIWSPPKAKGETTSIGAHIRRLDPVGMFFLVPAIISLLLALQWDGSTYSWSNGRIIALFVVFGVLILVFATVQIKMPDTATIPARVITQRSIICTALYIFFLASSMILMLYYLPIWFQTVKLVNPLKSGIYTLPVVLSLVLASFISGFATQKIGYYVPVMYLCPCILSVGLGLMSTFNINTGPSHWIGYQIIAGFGQGLGMQTSALVVQKVIPHADVPIGIALMFFLQQLGGAIFSTVGQAILNNILVSRLSGISGLDPNEIVQQGATDLGSVVPTEDIVLVQQAYNFACTRIFLVAMGVTFIALLSSLGVEWKSIKKGKNEQGKLGGHGGPGKPDGAVPSSPNDQKQEETVKDNVKKQSKNGESTESA